MFCLLIAAALAQEVNIPRLIEKGYLADPDNLLSVTERRQIKVALKEIKRGSGLKTIIAIQNSLPSGWTADADFVPGKAATRLAGIYAKAWHEGSPSGRPRHWYRFGTKRKSFIILIVTRSRAAAGSAPQELEKTLFSKDNVRTFGLGFQKFFETRANERKKKSKESPEFLGLKALLSVVRPLLLKASASP